jgi:hypothetical protein
MVNSRCGYGYSYGCFDGASAAGRDLLQQFDQECRELGAIESRHRLVAADDLILVAIPGLENFDAITASVRSRGRI